MQHRLTFRTLHPSLKRESGGEGGPHRQGGGWGGVSGWGSSAGPEASCLEGWVPPTRSSKSEETQTRHRLRALAGRKGAWEAWLLCNECEEASSYSERLSAPGSFREPGKHGGEAQPSAQATGNEGYDCTSHHVRSRPAPQASAAPHVLLADNPWPTGRGERWTKPSEASLPAAGLSGLHPMNFHCDSTRWGRKYRNRQAYVATASPPGSGASLWETPWRRGRV